MRRRNIADRIGMWRYIVAHWQGEQSLPRSVFINWLLVYLLLVLFAGLAETLSFKGSAPLVWVFIGFMLVWLVWAIVGTLRGGWRLLADPGASVLRKFGAVITILAVTAFAVVASADVYHIFLGRPVPDGGGIKAAHAVRAGKRVVDFGTGGRKMTSTSSTELPMGASSTERP